MLRRHPVVTGILVLSGLFVALTVMLQVSQQEEMDFLNPGLIGVIEISGVLLEAKPIVTQIKKMEKEVSIKGVMIRLNSPGGGVVPAQEIYDALNQLRDKKPVYSSMGTVAASGAYYVACATDRVFANPGTITGSIGVLMEWFNVSELGEKIGVTPVKLTSVPNKSLISTFDKLSPEKQQILQQMLDDTHQQFVAAVQQGRPKLTSEEVELLSDGRIYTGSRAQEVGLVDDLGSYEAALNALAEEVGLSKPQTIQFNPKEPSFKNLMGLKQILERFQQSLFPEAPNVSLQYLLN